MNELPQAQQAELTGPGNGSRENLHTQGIFFFLTRRDSSSFSP